ncbi:MAG: Fe-S protein assembly co-chaperone HscB [Acidobacteriota bacterium]|nr:Fe-S protein assembly co-chaperone HscB [Acidobacteriota bacterium]
MATKTANPPVNDAADYFGVFGLPRKLELDRKALEQEFYKLSRKLHPDVFARAPQAEQERALEQSSRLNDAYRTLRDPIERTKYLLALEGVKLEEQSAGATEQARTSGQEKKQAVPPELLEEVFELNLQLEEARMAKKTGEREGFNLARELAQQKQIFEAKLAELEAELKAYWAEWDAGVAASDDAKKAFAKVRMTDLLNRRSYIRNLVRDVNEVLEG